MSATSMACEAVRIAGERAGIGPFDILDPTRTRSAARARYAVMLTLHNKGLTYSRIGRLLERHHSTIMQGCDRARQILLTDSEFAELVEALS